ncbi:MAG: hypothetical protein AAF705_11545 [Bacteroidota bacterium]
MKNLILPLCILFALPAGANIHYSFLRQSESVLQEDVYLKFHFKVDAYRYLGLNYVKGDFNVERDLFKIDLDGHKVFYLEGSPTGGHSFSWLGESLDVARTEEFQVEQLAESKLRYSSQVCIRFVEPLSEEFEVSNLDIYDAYKDQFSNLMQHDSIRYFRIPVGVMRGPVRELGKMCKTGSFEVDDCLASEVTYTKDYSMSYFKKKYNCTLE